MKRILYLLAVIALCACEHKDLCYHHPHTATVRVVFDWKDAPDANPEGMCVFFYPLEEGEGSMQRFDFRGKTGGEVDIRVGKYRLLCYNNDTETVQFRGMNDFDAHEGFTREGDLFESVYGSSANTAPRAKGAEQQRVVICPDMMWGCTATEVEITETGISYICVPEKDKDEWLGKPVTNTEQIITLYPHELVCTYTYEVRNVAGLSHVTQMCASLSGMAPSLFFSIEALGRECITLPFEARAEDDSTIVGGFYTFGHHEENPQEHRMLLYIWMDDGNKYYYGSEGDKFNVTEQVHTAPDKRHVHLIINGLDLPQPIADDSGFNPSVDDWQEVNQDINM